MRAEFATDNWQCPQGWRYVRVGDVVALQRGFDLPVQNRKQGPFPVIGSNGVVGFHGESKALGPGVVVGRSGTIGKSYYSEGAYWPLNTGLYVKDFHGNEPLFVHFFFQWFDVGPYSAGVSVPTLNRNLVHEALVSIPPVHEQRAIAGVLAKIRAAVEVQEKIVAALKELKAATMAKLFREGLQDQGAEPRRTRFGDVPADWVAVPLAEVAYIQTGVAKGRRIGDESATVELPYLRVANVQDGYLDLSEIKTIRLRETERRRYSLQSDDVLLTEGGDFDKLGRGYLWHGQIPECVHQNHIFAVRTSGGKLLPDFFAYLAQSPYGKAYFLSVAHKTTNLASINSTKLKGFPVLLPLLSEQRKIAMTLKKIDESIDLQATRLKTLKSAFSSMLHRLMTGRVRVTRKMIALQALEARRKRRPRWSSKVDEKVLEEVVRRIVEAVAPEKIILFGSAARGEMGPDSDLDLLVVKACENTREVARTIRRQLIRIGVPKDVVVVTPEDVEEYKDIPGYVIGPALKEGKVLYAA